MIQKIKQSLTYVLAPFLTLTVALMAVATPLYLLLRQKKYPRFEVFLDSEGYTILFSLIVLTLVSLWLSNQRTENTTLRIFCRILFIVSSIGTVVRSFTLS